MIKIDLVVISRKKGNTGAKMENTVSINRTSAKMCISAFSEHFTKENRIEVCVPREEKEKSRPNVLVLRPVGKDSEQGLKITMNHKSFIIVAKQLFRRYDIDSGRYKASWSEEYQAIIVNLTNADFSAMRKKG